MPVNKSEQAFFEELAKVPQGKPVGELSLQEFRQLSDVFNQYTGDAAAVNYRDLQIPVSDGSKLQVRLYNHDMDNAPILVFYPGNGYVINLFEANCIACSRIADYSKVKVAVVNFRRAPEHPLPQPIHDCLDCTKYLVAHSKQFAIDRDKIFIGGISSGAHAAAVISNWVRNDADLPIKRQILVNGSYDSTFSYHEFDEYENEDLLCLPESIDYLMKNWGVASDQWSDPAISPALETNFENLPKTTILVGEYDRVRNHSELYFKRLKAANVDVEKITLQGQTHNTMLLRSVMSDGPDPSKVIADIINRDSKCGI